MKDYGNVPYELEIVNLGSTFSKYGFDYRYFGKKGFNFAVAPQPLKVDYEVLEKYQNHIKEGAVVVVVVVCPFGFSLYEYEPVKVSALKRCVNFGKQLVKKIIGEKRIQQYRYRRQKGLSQKERTQINASQMVNGWKAEFSLDNTTTQKPTPDLEKTFAKTRGELEKILHLCRERRFRPVIINMPAVEEEHGQFSDDFLRLFYDDNIKQVDTSGVPVMDYFRDKRFNNAALYENCADCLNDSGRKLFAEILIEDLKRNGLWED